MQKNIVVKSIGISIMLTFLFMGSAKAMPTNVSTPEQLQSILTNSVVEGNTVKLMQDVTLGSTSIRFNSGNFVFDLNGFTVTSIDGSTLWIGNNEESMVEVRIKDSSLAKNGKIHNIREDNNSYDSAIWMSSGTLIIDGGIFESEDYGLRNYKNNNAIINGGTFIGPKGGVVSEVGTRLTINGGNIGNANSAFGLQTFGTTFINGGTFIGRNYGIAGQQQSNITITDGNIGTNTSFTSFLTLGNAIINGGVYKGIYGIVNAVMFALPKSFIINDANVDVSSTAIEIIVFESIGPKLNPDSISMTINGGTFKGGETGFHINQLMYNYLKIKGGHFISTDNSKTDVGAIKIDSRSEALPITYTTGLKDYIESGYNINISSVREIGVDNPNDLDEDIDTYYWITAKDVFIAKESNIIVSSDIKNGIVSAGKNIAFEAEEIPLTITPNFGYIIKSVKLNDNDEGINNSGTGYSFIMPKENANIFVEFEKIIYSVLDNIPTYKIGNNNDVSFRIDAPMNLFKELFINDNEVNKDNYILTEGSTIITLKQSFLSSLKPGAYKILATFTDGGESTINFEVTEEPVNPKTYDNVLNYVYLCISSLSIFFIILTKQYKKDN